MAKQQTSVAKKPPTFIGYSSEQVTDVLVKYQEQIVRVLQRKMSPERFLQICSTIIKDPNLSKCSQSSIIGAVLQCANLGLDPTPQLGLVHLVPFFSSKKGVHEIQLIIGYQGYIQLARNSGTVRDVYAHVVYENDEFELEYGSTPRVVHRPALTDRGKMIGAYAVWMMVDGAAPHIEWMNEEDIMAVEEKSSKSKDSPWKGSFRSEMYRKSPVRRSRKYVALSTDIQEKLASDETIVHAEDFHKDRLNVAALQRPEDEPEVSANEAVEDRLKAKAAEIAEVEEVTAVEEAPAEEDTTQAIMDKIELPPESEVEKVEEKAKDPPAQTAEDDPAILKAIRKDMQDRLYKEYLKYKSQTVFFDILGKHGFEQVKEIGTLETAKKVHAEFEKVLNDIIAEAQA